MRLGRRWSISSGLDDTIDRGTSQTWISALYDVVRHERHERHDLSYGFVVGEHKGSIKVDETAAFKVGLAGTYNELTD